MTANATATRAQAITAAAERFARNPLPHWPDDEYLHGICTVIADTFGTDSDVHNARTEVWEEIRAEHQRAELRARAEKIASRHAANAYAYALNIGTDDIPAAGEEGARDIVAVREVITAAILEALTDKETPA